MKNRLDLILVNRNLVNGRERAKALIMEGVVFVNGEKEDKPGTVIDEDKIKTLEVRAESIPFVSRGGLKLDKAVHLWGLDFTGMTCLDIGASTGGFTDCMLQNGAQKVYSVDVGYGQLAYSLRTDERVCCMEKTNFRYSTPADFDDKIDFAGADVSFISLEKILIPARAVMKPDARMVALIKPQFEAGREKVGKNGVVRDKTVHVEVIERVSGYATQAGFKVLNLDFSPIRGPKGNIEYLLFLQNTETIKPSKIIDGEGQFCSANTISTEQIRELVERAHESFHV